MHKEAPPPTGVLKGPAHNRYKRLQVDNTQLAYSTHCWLGSVGVGLAQHCGGAMGTGSQAANRTCISAISLQRSVLAHFVTVRTSLSSV